MGQECPFRKSQSFLLRREIMRNECVGNSQTSDGIIESRSHAQLLSHVWLFVTPWTVALQSPLSMGFSKHEYWSGLPFLSSGDLLDPGIKPKAPALQVVSCIAGGILHCRWIIYYWATRKAGKYENVLPEATGVYNPFNKMSRGVFSCYCPGDSTVSSRI